MEKRYQEAYEASIAKITRNSGNIGVAFPHVAEAEDGSYNREEPWFWTGGFWGGLLHLAWRETKDSKLFDLARSIEQAQDVNFTEFVRMHHDVGFLWIPTAVADFRETGNPDSLIRGMKAAAILASRFNIQGRYLRAWNSEQGDKRAGYAIIDSMMNLSLLYWAAREMKDPRYKHIAMAHADTVLSSFLRPDFTVPHIVEFDPETGVRIGTCQGQGKSPDSVWSRGQAWALYGFAISYRESGAARYLAAADGIARHYMESLPSDGVPYWDFQSDDADKWVRDSSSACIASSGMFELYRLTGNPEFLAWGKELLDNLLSGYCDFSSRSQGIVMKGTVNYARKKHVNVPIIYGDFFFVEALGKLHGLEGLF